MIAVGDIVRYHPLIGGADDGKDYEVCAVDPNLGGSKQAVAWLVGKRGCVAQKALSRVQRVSCEAFLPQSKSKE